jgi:hypothetical protein
MIIPMLSFAAMSSSAFAAPVTWTLYDAFFDGGGSATGQFTYDASLNVYSDVQITTTPWEAGGFPSAASFDDSTIIDSSYENLLLENGVVYEEINMFFGQGEGLTDAGGTVSLFIRSTIVGTATLRRATAGYVSTVSAVPVPAAVWLFGSGLVGLIGVARRKART